MQRGHGKSKKEGKKNEEVEATMPRVIYRGNRQDEMGMGGCLLLTRGIDLLAGLLVNVYTTLINDDGNM